MAQFDAPNVNIQKKSNEENIHALNSSLIQTQDTVSYYIDYLLSKYEDLNSRVTTLESED